MKVKLHTPNLLMLAIGIVLSVMIHPVLMETAYADFENGQEAVDVIGQTDEYGVITYLKSLQNNGQYISGLRGTSNVAVDEVNHRMFVSDSMNHRVLVFNLDSSNNPLDYHADYVLGQPNLQTVTQGATQSKFNFPSGLVLYPERNLLFVADTNNSRIMIFNIEEVETGENAINVLGQVNFTSNASGLSQSQLHYPFGLAIDKSKDLLYVADRVNSRAMVFDIETITDGDNAVAVLGQPDYTTATAGTTINKFNEPYGIELDTANDILYVGDTGNHRVMVFDVAIINNGEDAIKVLGQTDFTTATSGLSKSKMNRPMCVALDVTNSLLYTIDRNNNRVLIFDVSSIDDGEDAVHVLGQSNFTDWDWGSSQSAMASPYGVNLSVDYSILYVSDFSNNRVLIFDVSSILDGENAVDMVGQTNTVLSSGTPLYGKGGQYNSQYDSGFSSARMIIDTEKHRLYVSDYFNNRVIVFNLDSSNNLIDRLPDYVLGQPDIITVRSGTTQTKLYNPEALALDQVNQILYVADYNNHRVMVFDVDELTNGEAAIHVLGQTSFTLRSSGLSDSKFNGPVGLALDTSNNRLFVGERNNHRIMVFDVAEIIDGESAINVLGQTNFTTNTSGLSDSKFYRPRDLKFDDATENLFVADTENHRIMVFDATEISDGESAVNVLGQTNFTSNTATCSQSGLNFPGAMDIDTLKNHLIVGDRGNNRVIFYDIESISNGENATTVLGQTEFNICTFGTTQSKLRGPDNVGIISSNGNLFVADSTNNRIMLFQDYRKYIDPALIPEFSDIILLLTLIGGIFIVYISKRKLIQNQDRT